MVNWNVEEALNLIGMEVHGDKAVDTGNTKQVGNELCSDAHPWFVLAILSCPTEIGDDSIDTACRCPFGCVDHKQQLHEVVGVGESALHKEDVASTNRFLVGNGKFSV